MKPDLPLQESIVVLIVEDNEVDAEMIRRLLSPEHGDFDLVFCRGLAEAREVEGVDVVLLDLGLPESFGLETFRRAREFWEDLPLIVISGGDDMEIARQAVEAGAQDYLVKGRISGQALRRTLLYSVERHRIAQERQRLVHDLERSRRLEAIGQLAAGVAHEINTPTQYVSDNTRFLQGSVAELLGLVERLRGAAQRGDTIEPRALSAWLQEADADYLAEELPQAIEQSLEGLDRITGIVRALREFSHPPRNERVPVDLRHALETTLVVASNEWRYAAEVTTDFEADFPLVPCDPGEMNQVFLNLIVNAAHAVADRVGESGEKGRIEVGTRTVDADWVELWVRDTGTGIPRAHRAQVFEPFFTTKEVGRGTGQGLALAYDVVVRRHGGRLEFETEDGQGTRFQILLPRRASVRAAA